MPPRSPVMAQTLGLLRSRLCRRIALVVALSIFAVEAAIVVPSYLGLRDRLFEALEGDILKALELSLALQDDNRPEPLLAAAWPSLQGLGITGLAVFDATGRPLAAHGEPVLLVPQPSGADGALADRRSTALVFRRHDSSAGVYSVLWPAAATALPFTVSAKASTAAIAQELRSFVFRIGGLVLIIAFVVTAATVAILGREVLTPVLAIHRNLTAAHADPGHAESYRLNVQTGHEIEETVNALNALLERLAELRRRDLHEQEQRFEDFARSSSDWFWEMDRHLRFSFFSDRFAEVTGVDERELLGKTREETGIPGVDPAVWEQHLQDLRAHRPFRNFTHPREKADGQVVWLAISGTPAFDAEGRFSGYRGTGRDITADVELKEQLLSAKELAEAANRTKSEFLANMSRELRTPLNAVIGFSELMLATTPEDRDHHRPREYLTDITEAAQHLLALINDILDLSKIEAGVKDMNEEVVDVEPVAQSVLRVVRQRAEKAGVSLTYEAESPLPGLYADERKLKQALLNLLSNAVKFTTAGGTVTLKIGCAAAGGYVFEVADTGIGMAPDEIPKALRKFGQVDSDLNRRYEGTGLGLPLTKALIELHQGSLAMESAPGKGTTVTLHLPPHRTVQETASRSGSGPAIAPPDAAAE